ncbi:MAG: hypothetical protein HY913_21325 [Desulfomonile tiedjei]|nr:hypothetical protein [Desulfomonile tiedjei]
MAGNKFLNPYLKMVLCLLGMALMGYFLYPAVQAGEFSDHMTIVRALVFLGFSYLLMQSVREAL